MFPKNDYPINDPMLNNFKSTYSIPIITLSYQLQRPQLVYQIL